MTFELDTVFDRFETTAFRLETLQRYEIDEDEPTFKAWRTGRARPTFSVRTSPWAARLAATTMAGKSWRRVRAVDLPLSDYVRWELAAYAESTVLGEEIGVLVRQGEFAELHEDFWLFDAGSPAAFAVLMVYDDAGRQGEHRLVTESAIVRTCEAVAARAWHAATPFNEFVVEHQHATT